MKQVVEYNSTIFESIKHINKEGKEYWLARELMQVLEYTRWGNFVKVMERQK